MLVNLFSSIPYNSSKYVSEEIPSLIKKIVETKGIDIIYIDHLHMAIYSNFIKRQWPNMPLIFRSQNVETTIMERFYQNQSNPFIKIYAFMQYLKMRSYESKIVEVFDKCFMLTENDSQRIKEMNPKVKEVTIPAGVDIIKYSPKPNTEEGMTILFLGSLNWLPNADGLKWFIDNVLDKVIAEIPNIKFFIVGKDPIDQVKRLHDGNKIIVTGYVEDERDYISKCSVFIVPLRIGGGMRIKILNAMSMGKCIVSTSIGAEGINLKNHHDIYISDEPETFAKDIIFLLRNQAIREKVSLNARETISTNYSWKAVFKIADAERVEVLEKYKEVGEES
jgi:Glycosyltransferase